MLKPRYRQLGFTIIEVLVVVVVLAVLAAITFVSYAGIQDRAEATKAAALAKQYTDIFKVYHYEEGGYPRLGSSSGRTVCLGPPDSFPPDEVFEAGECSKWKEVDEDGSEWTSSYSVNDDFNDLVSSYGAVIPSDLKTVSVSQDFSNPWSSWSVDSSYRGLVYYKDWSPQGNAYITYFVKGNHDCSLGESQSYEGITECKISLDDSEIDSNLWGGHGGEG